MTKKPVSSDCVCSDADGGYRESGELRYSVLSPAAIWSAAALIVLMGAGVVVWLLIAYGHGDDHTRNQLEAIKTAGTMVIGTGGAAALLLAARRQRTAEIALKQKDREQAHQERAHALQEQIAVETKAHQQMVAEHARAESVDRRITELYTKAADQLGSDKAPVRMAGLFALERLAQNEPTQRQTITNILCAYLRMPYDRSDDTDTPALLAHTQRKQELEVRLTAQRILADHLRPGANARLPVATFWKDVNLDFTGAVLVDFDLAKCTTGNATFTAAHFVGLAQLTEARFEGIARFDTAKFDHIANFEGASFLRHAEFNGVQFNAATWFDGAEFGGFNHDEVRFHDASFRAIARFGSTKFYGSAGFDGVEFLDTAQFDNALFIDRASFNRAKFNRAAWFDYSKFGGAAQFSSTQFNGAVDFDQVEFELEAPDDILQFCASQAASTDPNRDTDRDAK